MRKITSLFFMAVCLCFLAGTAKAQTPADWSEGGIWYKVIAADKVAVIQNPAGQDYTGTVTVPAAVTHEGVTYTVTAVGNRAFAYDGDAETTVEHVNLPSTIVSFGGCAFQYCKYLKSIVIPDATIALWDDDFDGVDDGEGGTFMGCTGLEEITIGSGITNMSAPNGLFNPVGSNLRKVTCHATAPPTIEGDAAFAVFNGDVSRAVLLVPVGSIEAYLVDYWWNFATAEQYDGCYGAGIYEIGALLSPWNIEATMAGLITWTGDAGAYNVIISPTELDEVALAGAHAERTTDTEYDVVWDENVTENAINYAYLQSDYGDGNTSTWASTSFYYYTGAFCEYTVSGEDIYYTVDPEDQYEVPQPWGWGVPVYLEFWQAGLLIATVDGDAAFAEGGATVSLMTGVPATLEWKGGGQYDDPCTLTITDATGNIILSTDELTDAMPETLGTIEINCGTAIKKLAVNNASITPTLSTGFVTVTAEVGSVAKVTDLTGHLLKQEAITGTSQKIELNYANGVYLITLENGQSRFVQKVVLKR